MLFHPKFSKEALRHIDLVESALKQVKGLCWRLPLAKLLHTFVEKTRAHQLLIVQPNSAAMIYASNQKPGCFTGFVKPGPASQRFDFLNFIKSQALPGPGSLVHCILQHYGPTGPTSFYTMAKRAPLS